MCSKAVAVTDIARGIRIIARCHEIAAASEVPNEITRTFLSPQMHQVHALVRGWMEAAGMTVRVDGIGNLRGLWRGRKTDSPRLIIGSHLDTVPNAGAFDGILGVVLGVALVEELRAQRLPFAIEVIGFSEEEGVRFAKPFLGSLALVGRLDGDLLALKDAYDVTVEDSIRTFGLDPADIPAAKLSAQAFAYLEFHIEQGPVLESEDKALGIVDAIAGQTRLLAIFIGEANHAGTTPMKLRHDAMSAAAEWIVAVERIASEHEGLVATVGKVEARPGAGNVIPGEVSATLDLRHAADGTRLAALDEILRHARQSSQLRGVFFRFVTILDQAAVTMNVRLTKTLEKAAILAGTKPVRMVSGAGHDAMIVAPSVPSAMLFLRSPGGVSHHPDETVLAEDVEAAIATGLEFLKLLEKDRSLTNASPKDENA